MGKKDRTKCFDTLLDDNGTLLDDNGTLLDDNGTLLDDNGMTNAVGLNKPVEDKGNWNCEG